MLAIIRRRGSSMFCSDFIKSLSITKPIRTMSSQRLPLFDSQVSDYDQTQLQYMDEPCILVNENDEVIGTESKKACHLLENINKGMLHRAFSVFLFNSEGKLLLQQRSDAKITYPGLFTNTCCSHPLMKYPLEADQKKAIGVKRAAQRKLRHELGIPPDQVPLNAFLFITRVRYQSENIPADGIFGENEIDHILFIKKDVTISSNRNEVKSYTYINKEELKELMEKDKERCILTPWFRMISETLLFDWWDHMLNGKLKRIQDWKTIHKLN